VAGSKFPFHLTIVTVTNTNFEGTVDWPTLNNAKTKAKGTLSETNNTFSFTEYEVIRGEEDVEVPSEYTGKCDNAKSISGAVNEAAEDGGTWKASKVETQDEDADEMETEEETGPFTVKSVHKGVCYTFGLNRSISPLCFAKLFVVSVNIHLRCILARERDKILKELSNGCP